MKTQEIGMALIIVTICLSFFATVILSAARYPVAPELQTVVTVAFTGFVGVASGWFAGSRVSEQKQAATLAGLRAETAERTVAVLRSDQDVPK